MKLSDFIVRSLVNFNVNHIFAVPGVNVLPLLNEIQLNEDTSLIVCSSESGATYMADGYSRINGLGCCIGTTGPGITNMITGVAGAYYDSIPLVVISAQVAESEYDKYSIQEMTGYGRTPDVISMYSQITKQVYRLEHNRLKTFGRDLQDLLMAAITGRKGPVYLEICEDLWDCDIDIDEDQMPSPTLPTTSYSLNNNDFKMIIKHIEMSKRPLVLIGNGTADTEPSSITKFVDSIGGYCVSTALAKGKLSDSYERYLGVIGCYGNHRANALLQEADLIIILGASLGYLSTCGWSLDFSAAKIIRVDIDKNELNKNVNPDFAFNLSISDFIYQFNTESHNVVYNGEWKSIPLSNISANEGDTFMTTEVGLDPVSVMNMIDSKFSKTDSIYVVDVGQNAYWAERYLKSTIAPYNSFIIHGGMGAMGYGVAASIGVRLAQLKNKTKCGKVICICGDGGYLMNGLELNTSAIYNVDVIWIVMNNGCLGTQKAWSEKNQYSLLFENTKNFNFVQNAISQGVQSYTVNDYKELEETLERACIQDNSTLINICISNEKYPKSYYGQAVRKINR